MIDIKLIRTNPDFVKVAIEKKVEGLSSVIDEILEIDAKRREETGKVEKMKAEQNAATKKIPQIKKEGGDVSAVMAEMKALSAEIKKADEDLSALEAKQHELLLALPNLPDEDVCAGGKENNRVLHQFKKKNRF